MNRSDARHIHLHRAAFQKLREHPERMAQVRETLDRWQAENVAPAAAPYLEQWREMLTAWPFDLMEETVLDPERGQALRQASPLAGSLKPQERWEALRRFAAAFDRSTPERP